MSLDLLLDILFPRFCIGCGRLGKYLCQECKETINFYTPQTCPYCESSSPFGLTHPKCTKKNGLDGMFILSHYDGLIKEIIHRVKYQSEYALLDEIAKILGDYFHGKFSFDYLAPIPLSPKRERSRGFNQAEILARSMIKDSRFIDFKIANILARVRDTRPQFDLTYEERKQNMKDAFTLNYELITKNLTGFSFCLVDDVATTGATIFEAAKVLKKAGAKKVWAICLARGG